MFIVNKRNSEEDSDGESSSKASTAHVKHEGGHVGEQTQKGSGKTEAQAFICKAGDSHVPAQASGFIQKAGESVSSTEASGFLQKAGSSHRGTGTHAQTGTSGQMPPASAVASSHSGTASHSFPQPKQRPTKALNWAPMGGVYPPQWGGQHAGYGQFPPQGHHKSQGKPHRHRQEEREVKDSQYYRDAVANNSLFKACGRFDDKLVMDKDKRQRKKARAKRAAKLNQVQVQVKMPPMPMGYGMGMYPMPPYGGMMPPNPMMYQQNPMLAQPLAGNPYGGHHPGSQWTSQPPLLEQQSQGPPHKVHFVGGKNVLSSQNMDNAESQAPIAQETEPVICCRKADIQENKEATAEEKPGELLDILVQHIQSLNMSIRVFNWKMAEDIKIFKSVMNK